jgi:transcriptional regulator of arginine metabolism
MSKAARQSLLLEIVREWTPRTQEEVAELLAGRGVDVSQVTLSRDLRELGVVKSPQGYREPAAAPRPSGDALLRTLREFVVGVEPARNLVVLKTNPGAAAAVALGLDRSGWPEIVGTVAGDDTIFAATASAAAAKRLAGRLEQSLDRKAKVAAGAARGAR